MICPVTYVVFLMFLALSVYAQNLTGFALSLILLGLVGATDLLPLPDVVNALSVISAVNASLFLYKRRAFRLQPELRPAMLASALGVVLGVLAQAWILGHAYQTLRLVLGLCIIACAGMLWHRAAPQETPSKGRTFFAVGLVSGILGGLFSASGPPMVYQVYKQPWTLARIQESLILFFGMGSLLRLLAVFSVGTFSAQSAMLSAMALPVVVLITSFAARRPPPFSPGVVKMIACGLLLGSGATMLYSAASAMAAG